jgi:hypothetical protein
MIYCFCPFVCPSMIYCFLSICLSVHDILLFVHLSVCSNGQNTVYHGQTDKWTKG